MNPINKPAAPAVGWQQARVLEMQAEYADAFDTQTGRTKSVLRETQTGLERQIITSVWHGMKKETM